MPSEREAVAAWEALATKATDADRVRIAVEALETAKSDILALTHARWSEAEGTEEQWVGHIDQALATLKAGEVGK